MLYWMIEFIMYGLSELPLAIASNADASTIPADPVTTLVSSFSSSTTTT